MIKGIKQFLKKKLKLKNFINMKIRKEREYILEQNDFVWIEKWQKIKKEVLYM